MQSWFELHLQFTICGFSWINYWVAWSLIPHSSTLRQHFAGWSWHWHLKMLTRHSIDCFSHRHHPGGRRNCTFPLVQADHFDIWENKTTKYWRKRKIAKKNMCTIVYRNIKRPCCLWFLGWYTWHNTHTPFGFFKVMLNRRSRF